MKFTRIILLLMLFAKGTLAQVAKYSNEFLSLGVGARAAGMGNAVLSSVDDATAAYWNPAGLMHIENNLQIALMHNEQLV